MVWAASEDALNARFVSPLPRVAAAKQEAATPSGRGASTFLPPAAATGPGRGPGAERASREWVWTPLWGCSQPRLFAQD